MGMETNNGAGQ